MEIGEGRGCSGCWMDIWCGCVMGVGKAPGRGEYRGVGRGKGELKTWFERLRLVDASGFVGDCQKFEI